MSHRINIIRLKAVSNLLSDLQQEFVFVGGAVVSLYADREAEEVRPTDDVDVLVEIYTRIEYTKMEEKLRSLGFSHDIQAKFVGRFLAQGLIVDFMPMDEKVLGFNNKWYADGFKNAVEKELDERTSIKIFTAPYFIASKLEAFKSRGKNASNEYDGRLSTDFEDIVFVLLNRRSVWEEMEKSDESLKNFLHEEFKNLLKNPYLEEWIDVHTGYSSPAAQLIILPGLQKFVSKAVPPK